MRTLKNRLPAATLLSLFVVACSNSAELLGIDDATELDPLELVGSNGGLKGQYFNNGGFNGNPAIARIDPVVDFLFGFSRPDPAITNGSFSAIWTGRITPPETASYTFFIRSGDSFRRRDAANDTGPGDRVRLVINDRTVIDSDGGFNRSEVRGTLQLQGGVEHRIRLTYAKRQNETSIRLFWANDLPDGATGALRKQVVASKYLQPASTLPTPFVDGDVGSSRSQGFSLFDGQTQVLKATGSGQSIGGSSDNFYFVYQPVEADAEVIVRVTQTIAARVGIMFRENLTAGSRQVFAGLERRNAESVSPTFIRRSDPNQSADTSRLSSRGTPTDASPLWLRLKRRGDSFESFHSTDGKSWSRIGRDFVEMGERAFVGLAFTSSGSRAASAVFDNISVERNYRFLVRDGVASEGSANDYYASIGVPQGLTLDQWIAQRMTGRVVSAFFRNQWDLGFWREMNCTETLGRGRGGCWVRNWENENDRFNNNADDLGTVAMDVSPEGYTRFYVFGPDGVLSPKAVLDAEGAKFAPQLCTTCHGGNHDPKSGNPDMGAIFREYEPTLLQLRSDLVRRGSEGRRIAEREFAALNRAVRTANQALRGEAEGGALGVDKARAAVVAHIESMYASTPDVLNRALVNSDNPKATDIRSTDPATMPPSWASDADADLASAKRNLWAKVVNPYCMNCHRFSSVDFTEYLAFQGMGNVINATPGNPRGERSLLKHYLRGSVLEDTSGNAITLPVMPQSEQMLRNLGLQGAEDDDVRGPVKANAFNELDAINRWLSNHQRVNGIPENLR